jgi:hypothetical protein
VVSFIPAIPQPLRVKRDGGTRWVACGPLDHRLEQIVLETDRWRIEGNLTLPREGYRSRLSDFVNQRDREYFSIQDATLTALDAPNEVQELRFVMVARRHIRFIAPTTEQSA